MSALDFTVLPNGNYLLRKALESSFQVVKELVSSFNTQSLALSFDKKEKSLNLTALVDIA